MKGSYQNGEFSAKKLIAKGFRVQIEANEALPQTNHLMRLVERQRPLQLELSST